ncbi:tetratricopeptide repeat-containing sulfotransferase family protein [Dokdonella fugitiva]|nr:sulfotransferase [Dokdonella fugitiva]
MRARSVVAVDARTMMQQGAGAWLERGRAQVLRGDVDGAMATFVAALAEHPDSADVVVALAGLEWQRGRVGDAEARLQALLAHEPGCPAAAFLLARLLRDQARMAAVERTLRAVDWRMARVGDAIQAIELLDDCGRKRAALDVAEVAIAKHPDDPRLHAYAGMLAMQLGEFELARERYAFALRRDPRALEWQSAYGYAVSKRYSDGDDADFTLMQGFLERPQLADAARASVLFGLGKMHDDVGRAAQAAACLREANRLVAAQLPWSAKDWRRLVAARLDAKPVAPPAAGDDAFVPVFVLGLPRSGTTLVADWLARHPAVCNRGELPLVARLAADVARAANPVAAREAAARTYRVQVRQDDTAARWFIDKQPLNFLHVDFILATFPGARVVYCGRDARDTALSIFMQHFAGAEYAFAYDFERIAAVVQGERRLRGSALQRHPARVREVRYEEFVADPLAATTTLAAWIGLPPHDFARAPASERVISTASAWQARQPVHARSIGRWRAYAEHLPELAAFDP